MLSVSIPMTLSSVLSSINKNIDAFTVKRILTTYLPTEIAIEKYGILSGKVDTLIGLPLSINIAFATALVPAIAEAKAKRDMETAMKRKAAEETLLDYEEHEDAAEAILTDYTEGAMKAYELLTTNE